MKTFFGKCALVLLAAKPAFAAAPKAPTTPTAPAPHFMSAVQLAVHESSPRLVQRSQRLVIDQMENAFESWPELAGKRYEIRTAGNEVLFYLLTSQDMREPMQKAVSTMIQQLNGRVRARGRSMYYRTSLAQPSSGFLEVVVDDSHTKILSISAQSVPLRDLLKEMKMQLGSLSYLIPGECADSLVDWSFGENTPEPKTVDTAMRELATVFNLKLEKAGSYILSGSCKNQRAVSRHNPPADMLPNNFFPPSEPSNYTQVYLPMLPIGD